MFSSVDELRESVQRWLADERRRKAVANAGFNRVRDDTYARRAETILERTGLVVGAAS